jgi:hypothetical protein
VQPLFVTANAIVGLLWGLALIFVLIRLRTNSPAGLRRKKIQHIKAGLAALEKCSEAEFTARAMDCLLEALDTRLNPLNAGALISTLAIDEESKAELANLLAHDAESKYSASRSKAPDRNERAKILSALKKIPA